MSKIDTTVNATLVVDVQTRSVSNGTKTIWEVLTQDGTKWATFKTDLGNKALALKGQKADLKVSIAQNGDFTNYYLNDIRVSPNQAMTPIEQAAAQAQAAAAAKTDVTYDQYKDISLEQETRKNESIHRQVAAKVAGAISTDATDFWPNVEALFHYFQTGNTPFTATGAAESSVTSHAPSNDSWDTPPPHSDDDIPF